MGVGRAQRPANWVFCCQERYRQLGRRRWPSPPVSTCDHPHRNRRQPRPTGSDSGRAPRLSPPLATSGADFRSRLLAGMLAAAHGVSDFFPGDGAKWKSGELRPECVQPLSFQGRGRVGRDFRELSRPSWQVLVLCHLRTPRGFDS